MKIGSILKARRPLSRTLLAAGFILLISPAARPVQVRAPQTEAEWLRITTESGEFSILMPKQATSYVNQGELYFRRDGVPFKEERVSAAYKNGAVYVVKLYRVSNAKRGLEDLLDQNKDFQTFDREITVNGFPGRQFHSNYKAPGY